MSNRILTLAIVVLVLLVAFCGKQDVSADHGAVRCGGTGEKACIILTSPLVTKYIAPGAEVTWCVNTRARQYPGFLTQTATTMNLWAEELGFTTREVPYPSSPASTDCVIRHDMLDVHPCSACGAWVYISNMPVVIEYNAKAGYSIWLSTIGHEFGHAACLLDEHYDKALFASYVLNHSNWQAGERNWIHNAPTVMDSGTFLLSEYAPAGIYGPTQYDLDRCAEALKRPVGVPPCTTDPCYDGVRWRWVSGWSWEPVADEWFDPKGRLYWGPRESWGGRFSPLTRQALYSGTPYWDESLGTWNTVP